MNPLGLVPNNRSHHQTRPYKASRNTPDRRPITLLVELTIAWTFSIRIPFQCCTYRYARTYFPSLGTGNDELNFLITNINLLGSLNFSCNVSHRGISTRRHCSTHSLASWRRKSKPWHREDGRNFCSIRAFNVMM